MVQSILQAAQDYIKRGWHIFPLHGINEDGQCTCGNSKCSDAGKHPATNGGLKDATTDPKQVESWFKDSSYNIAVATGEISMITVLDIDIGKKGGDQTWADINSETGEPDTLMAETGSGGAHVFFNYNSALNTSSNTLGKGIDCRNDGGYIVAPPSRHRSGGFYSWANDRPISNLPAHLTKRKEKRGRPRNDDPTRKNYTIEEAGEMLSFVEPSDRDIWRKVGIILGRTYKRAEAAWDVYVQWSDSWGGEKGRNHDAIMHEAFHEISQQTEGDELTMGTIVYLAIEGGWAPKTGQVPVERFLYFAPGNNFIYRPTGAFWPPESVNASCSPVNDNGNIVKPVTWLKQNRLVTSMTKDPIIESEVSEGFDNRDGMIIEAEGAALYNGYRPPHIELGDPKYAKPFVDHVFNLMQSEGDANQFLDYMAHRVQKPGEKPRFALIVAGEQGVGKDTAISMCLPAIGIWNVASIDAAVLETSFNEHASAVLTIVSEIANQADMSKWAFNEKMKVLIAGQPDFITVNPKYGHKYHVRLHCGVIITTNHMMSGLFIPADDRRYDVISCGTRREMGLEDADERADYFEGLWDWYASQGGANHVAAYLMERDISKFRASTGQRRTKAHREVVMAGMSGDEWAIDALEHLDWPTVVRVDHLWSVVENYADEEMTRSQYNKKVQHSLRRLGYEKLNCAQQQDGRWRVENGQGKKVRVAVFYKREEIEMAEAVKKIKTLEAPF